MVAIITTEEEFASALEHDGLVVVDFFATWCGPCKVIAPILDKFSAEFTSAKFIKVDVDELSKLAQEYEITAMPTILFFKNKQVVHKVLGANPTAIKAGIASNI